MGPGKCPKCEHLVTKAVIHGLDAGVPFGPTWKGISLNCPSCNTVLSIQIDPIAIKADIIAGLLKALKQH